MPRTKSQYRPAAPGEANRPRKPWNSGRAIRWGCLAVLAALAGAAQQIPPPPLNPPHGNIITRGGRTLDANQQMELQQQNAKQNDYAAANTERRKQIGEDSARLLKLAAELKAEVDKTTKNTLSLAVIRKADEIEKLAHGVKEKMRLSVGGS